MSFVPIIDNIEECRCKFNGYWNGSIDMPKWLLAVIFVIFYVSVKMKGN